MRAPFAVKSQPFADLWAKENKCIYRIGGYCGITMYVCCPAFCFMEK